MRGHHYDNLARAGLTTVDDLKAELRCSEGHFVGRLSVIAGPIRPAGAVWGRTGIGEAVVTRYGILPLGVWAQLNRRTRMGMWGGEQPTRSQIPPSRPDSVPRILERNAGDWTWAPWCARCAAYVPFDGHDLLGATVRRGHRWMKLTAGPQLPELEA